MSTASLPAAARRRGRPRAPAGPFPLEPLLRECASVSTLSRAVGVDRATIGRRRQNGLSVFEADEWAVACGRHPIEVWSDWIELANAV